MPKINISKEIETRRRDSIFTLFDGRIEPLNPGHYREALDRAFVAMEHFNRFVVEHPVILSDLALYRTGFTIICLMAELHQSLGQHLDNTKTNESTPE